jgi:hypothetical protein
MSPETKPASTLAQDRAGKSNRRSSQFSGRGTARPRPESRRTHRCLGCGWVISKDSDYCGECTCEEDTL